MTVYFVRAAEASAMKIGYCQTLPYCRLSVMQSNSPVALELVSTIEGAGKDVEAELQKRYAADRIRGEWFRLTPEIEAEAARHPRPKYHSTHGSARPPEGVDA